MQRVRQPAVVGQLLAGILLGPSVFGAFWPAAQQLIFPASSSDRQMLNAVSELGVLLLLLLTGMETDLALVKRVRRSAAIASAAGILVPFACGYGVCEALPDSILPEPNRRLLASPFSREGSLDFLRQDRRGRPPGSGLSPPQSRPDHPRGRDFG